MSGGHRFAAVCGCSDASAIAAQLNVTRFRATSQYRPYRLSINTSAGTSTRERLSTSYVRALLPRLAIAAGLSKRIHAHALRHTAAYDLLSEGKRLDIISAQLGHSSIAVTSRYLAHVSQPEVHQAIRARTWSLEPTAADPRVHP